MAENFEGIIPSCRKIFGMLTDQNSKIVHATEIETLLFPIGISFVLRIVISGFFQPPGFAFIGYSAAKGLYELSRHFKSQPCKSARRVPAIPQAQVKFEHEKVPDGVTIF